jgi:hypothetical protein
MQLRLFLRVWSADVGAHLASQKWFSGAATSMQDAKQKDDLSPSASGVTCLTSTWQDIVEQYSKLKLTQASDKLPALVGLVKHVQELEGGTYRFGLWEKSLINDLLWRANGPLRSRLR